MFLVVVQLGAILAVVLLFWDRIWPFNFKTKKNNEPFVKMDIMQLWFKIIISCVPAAIVGLLFDEVIEDMFYNGVVVAGALIIYGVLFIVVENWNKGRRPGDYHRGRNWLQFSYYYWFVPTSGSYRAWYIQIGCYDPGSVVDRYQPWSGSGVYFLSGNPGYARSQSVKDH